MTVIAASPTTPLVALFNASDDTVEMVQHMLGAAGIKCLAGCHLLELRRSHVKFVQYLTQHDPQVVIFDLALPYKDNWQLLTTLRGVPAMQGRGVVVTTPNKQRLDEVIGDDSHALEIVGKPYDLDQIKLAVETAVKQAR